MMQNIVFITSPYSTTITTRLPGATMEKMGHEFPTIC